MSNDQVVRGKTKLWAPTLIHRANEDAHSGSALIPQPKW